LTEQIEKCKDSFCVYIYILYLFKFLYIAGRDTEVCTRQFGITDALSICSPSLLLQ